ncbi:MAG TPA: helix-turn-helix domain-containing protein [Microbacterium sp.]|jgi:AcrR family transcriptional regulator|uniref:TetR/AcrR family transcriptional regulator n=1 Tax=Microbacterium sp. TaxID=51671 RepID=UPI002F95427F
MAAARGPYAKGRAKRAEILDAALDVIDREGYASATVKELADAVGLSQNGLLHYFGSKDALFAEILRRRDEVTAVQIDAEHQDFADDLVQRILLAVDDEAAAPGFTQLSLRVTGEATEPDHAAHDFIHDRYKSVRFVVRDAVTRLQAAGRLSPDIDPAIAASLVFAAWDGLRLQWMYDRSIDIRANLLYLLRALGIEETAADERG